MLVMKYIISIFILSLVGCSSAPSSKEKAIDSKAGTGQTKATVSSKVSGFMPKTIESARAAAKQEDFCYYKENRGNKRCRFTLLSPEAEKTYLIYTEPLREIAKKECRDGQNVKIPRNQKRYMALRSNEDAVARIANFAVKKGANVINMIEVKPSYVFAFVYDCPGKVLNRMLRKKSFRNKFPGNGLVALGGQ